MITMMTTTTVSVMVIQCIVLLLMMMMSGGKGTKCYSGSHFPPFLSRSKVMSPRMDLFSGASQIDSYPFWLPALLSVALPALEYESLSTCASGLWDEGYPLTSSLRKISPALLLCKPQEYMYVQSLNCIRSCDEQDIKLIFFFYIGLLLLHRRLIIKAPIIEEQLEPIRPLSSLSFQQRPVVVAGQVSPRIKKERP